MNKKMKECRSCGAQIAKSAKICPHCGAKNKRPVLGTVLVILGIIMIIGALGGEDEPSKVGAAPAESMPNDVVVEATEPSEPEETVFAVGEKVELNDVVVTLIDVSENSGNSFIVPDAGNVYVVCEFTIENNSTEEVAVSSMLSFDAYADDYATSISLGAMTSVSENQLDGSIAAGKKMNGVVGYEVAADWQEIEIRFTPDFWTGKEIIFAAHKG